MLISNQREQLVNATIERIKFLIHGFKASIYLAAKFSYVVFQTVESLFDIPGPLVNYLIDKFEGNFSNCRMADVFHYD